jgi:hypothetical protein
MKFVDPEPNLLFLIFGIIFLSFIFAGIVYGFESFISLIVPYRVSDFWSLFKGAGIGIVVSICTFIIMEKNEEKKENGMRKKEVC